jgi:hypothetical protein
MEAKEKMYWAGKDIMDLSREELIEVIEYLLPLYINSTSLSLKLERENFFLIVDKKLLNK